jgi:hypothetical protein
MYLLLRPPLSGLSISTQRIVRGLVVAAAIVCASWWLLSRTAEWYKSRVCADEVLANVAGVSGFNLEISTADCWHSRETSVFISKSGRSPKTLVLMYDSLEVPAIAPIDQSTIRISLGDIGYIYCRNDRWQA